MYFKGNPSIQGTKKDPRPKTAPVNRSTSLKDYGLKPAAESRDSVQMGSAPNRKIAKDKEVVLKYFLEKVDPVPLALLIRLQQRGRARLR